MTLKTNDIALLAIASVITVFPISVVLDKLEGVEMFQQLCPKCIYVNIIFCIYIIFSFINIVW